MKINKYILGLIILLVYIIGIYGIYLMFIPLTPVKFTNSPFPVKTKIVKAGGQLTYIATHCKYINNSPIITRTLVDSIQYTLPEIRSSVSKGCGTRTIMTTTIPKIIPPGKYYLSLTLTYDLNPFRTYVLTVRTQEFEVIESTESANLK